MVIDLQVIITHQMRQMVTPTKTRKREPMEIMATIQILNSSSSVKNIINQLIGKKRIMF